MALGEAVVGEGGEFQPDLLADVVGDAIGPHPVEEPGLEIIHALAAALGTHCLTQHVGVGRVKFATSIAICINCSWKSGTPRVLASAFSSNGWR